MALGALGMGAAALILGTGGAGFVVASVGGAFSMNETCPACGGRPLAAHESCPVNGETLGAGLGRIELLASDELPLQEQIRNTNHDCP